MSNEYLQALLGNNSDEILCRLQEVSATALKAELVELFVLLISYVGFAETVDALKSAREVALVVAHHF